MKIHKIVLGALALCLVSAMVGRPAFAAEGMLDPSFDADGWVTTEVPLGSGVSSSATSVVVQPDGKIVAGGVSNNNSLTEVPADFGLVRYLPDGSLDVAFGNGGIVTTNFWTSTVAGQSNDTLVKVLLQPDGKILAAGTTTSLEFSTRIRQFPIPPGPNGSNDIALARYNPDGSLDTTFGTGGLVRTRVSEATAQRIYGAALQPDGRIVVAGLVYTVVPTSQLSTTPEDGQFLVARYLPDGTLDASFGTGGFVQTDFGGFESVTDLVITPDGKIIAVGDSWPLRSGPGLDPGDFVLARYDQNGRLDPSFGSGGQVRNDLSNGGLDAANSVVLLADGKILVGGSAGASGMVLVRYNEDGALDAGFGNGGVIAGTAGRLINDLALQPDGKIVATGPLAGGGSFGLLRFNADGSLDPAFGRGGTAIADRPANLSFAYAVALALQDDGGIVVAGASTPSATPEMTRFTLARFVGKEKLVGVPAPETPPAAIPPMTEHPTVSTGTPRFRVAVCSWGDDEAVYLDSGESFPVECPPMDDPMVLTSSAARHLQTTVGDYFRDRRPERLAVMRSSVAAAVAEEGGGFHLLTVDRPPVAGEVVRPVPIEISKVQTHFMVTKGAVIRPDDGSLEVLSAEVEAEIFSGSQAPILVVGVDAAAAQGGGSGSCSLTPAGASGPSFPYGGLSVLMLSIAVALLGTRLRSSL